VTVDGLTDEPIFDVALELPEPILDDEDEDEEEDAEVSAAVSED